MKKLFKGKTYTPEYQTIGVEPILMGPNRLPSDNPRAKKPPIQQPLPQENSFTINGFEADEMNDYSEDAFKFPAPQSRNLIKSREFQNFQGTPAPKQEDDLYKVLASLEEDEYILMVGDVALCSGFLLDIQEQAKLLVFGDHEYSQGNPVPEESLLILKRAKIKVGLFIE